MALDKFSEAMQIYRDNYARSKKIDFKYTTVSGKEINPLYTPDDLQGNDFLNDINSGYCAYRYRTEKTPGSGTRIGERDGRISPCHPGHQGKPGYRRGHTVGGAGSEEHDS